MGTSTTDLDAERPRTQMAPTNLETSEREGQRAGVYGTVMVVPSPVAVMENVPVLLEVYA
jgi:hypothetical protein